MQKCMFYIQTSTDMNIYTDYILLKLIMPMICHWITAHYFIENTHWQWIF